ncbi:MAG: DUF2971 domain-containing protein [Candidatus Hydrogenedentes bacterium]|nr:DUF2971 domain-containing protein [Candidatus Hydrogenedentota bacterium]
MVDIMSLETLLYHYTTPDGLIGIVESNTLWATNALYLNDSRELAEGMGMGREHLRAMLRAVEDPARIERIEWLLNQVHDFGEAGRTKPVFVCSLTTQHDQLSQWRAYCMGGGFAIGFPLDQLRACTESQRFDLHECNYVRAEQEALVSEIVDAVVRPWVYTSQLPVMDDDRRFKVSMTFALELLRIAPRLKDDSFLEEREWRIISQPDRPYEAENRLFRSRNGLVIPYTTVSLPDSTDFWGKVHIVVGPSPHPSESKSSVYELVRRYRGVAIAIENSRASYREW